MQCCRVDSCNVVCPQLFDKGVEMEVGVQTDLFVDRPATPVYVPAKTGADAHTQIYPGDVTLLFVNPVEKMRSNQEQSTSTVIRKERTVRLGFSHFSWFHLSSIPREINFFMYCPS